MQALWQMGVVEITNSNPQGALNPVEQRPDSGDQVDNQEQRALISNPSEFVYRLFEPSPMRPCEINQESVEVAKRLGLSDYKPPACSEMATLQSSLGKPDAAMSSSHKRSSSCRTPA